MALSGHVPVGRVAGGEGQGFIELEQLEAHLRVARIGLGMGRRGGAAEQRRAGKGGGAGRRSSEGVKGQLGWEGSR